MAHRVFLHIGLPKTGTSFLQATLRDNEAALEQQGLLLPGRRGDHFWACLDVCGQSARRRRRVDQDRVRGAWTRLVAEAQAWPGTVLFSNELFAGASEKAIARIIDDLSPAEVHVIVGVRDLARALTANWQQAVKAGRPTPLEDYAARVLDRARDSDRSPSVLFPDRLLAVWGEHVEPEHIHLIALAPKGVPREVLWGRFSDILGIDPQACVLSTTVNESLGEAEAELLRRVNIRLVPRLADREISTWVRDELANSVLGGRPRKRPLTVPEDIRPRVVQHSHALVESLRASGYDVHGRLEDLASEPGSLGVGTPEPMQAEDVLDTAVDTIAELVVRLRDTRRRERTLRRRLRRLRTRVPRRHPRPQQFARRLPALRLPRLLRRPGRSQP